MKLATGFVRPCNIYSATSHQLSFNTWQSSPQQQTTALKIVKNPLAPEGALHRASSAGQSLRDKWMEFQGIKNWEGLLDPLDDGLRDEILRYGEFVEAAYRSFEFDTSSPTYATCKYPRATMLSLCGVRHGGYRVTKYLHATCGVHLPDWTERVYPDWVSARSSWIGYVAVCTDEREIARLGRRDVVVAYRGTAMCMEWVENLRATLTRLPSSMQGTSHALHEASESFDTNQNSTAAHISPDSDPMVQSGLLSLYTSRNDTRSSLQDTIKKEINKILLKYPDEPLSITVVGHSLGAALATLTAHDITTTFDRKPLVTVVSFGGPRVGNRSFRRQLEKSGAKVLRIVNSDDPITKVPGFVLDEKCSKMSKKATKLSDWVQRRVIDTQWVYAEIGNELRLSSKDCPHLNTGNVATCHDLKTYLHLVDNFVSSNCPLRTTAKKVLSRAQHHEKQQLLAN